MKLLCTIVACCCFAQAQAQCILSGKITNALPNATVVVNVPFDAWYHKANSVEVQPDSRGNFSVTLPVNRPQTIFLDYAGTRIYVYAAPEESLKLNFDGRAFPAGITFSGSLKKENAFRQELGLSFYRLGHKAWNDTADVPEAILAAIAQNQQEALIKLQSQKKGFTTAFYHMSKADIQYFGVANLWQMINTMEVWGQKSRSAFGWEEWRKTLVAAHKTQPISHAEAVPSYFYQEMLAYYPRFLQMSSSKDELAQLAQTIMDKPFAEARKEIKEKGERFWEHQLLVYGLQGAALESALASFLNNGIYQGDLGYQQEAYDDFLHRFPQSVYRPYLEQQMQRFWRTQEKKEQAEIELVQHSNQLKKLDDILPALRGKVVYIDLWGSWCGPCREEFGYTQALKERFKGKAVDFIYIAFERSANPQKSWQETIRFYALAGQHILASKELVKYFEELYAQGGKMVFPSYLLIDKEGKLVNIHAARPSSKEMLYKQIENLL